MIKDTNVVTQQPDILELLKKTRERESMIDAIGVKLDNIENELSLLTNDDKKVDALTLEKQEFLKLRLHMIYERDITRIAVASLSPDKQFILKEFYVNTGQRRQEIVDKICTKLNCESSNVYKLRRDAVKEIMKFSYVL